MASTKTDSTDKVVYLLGFGRASARDSKEIDGLGYAISSIDFQGVRSWYVLFDATEFQGSDAAENLEDLEWLTPRVLAHQQAIDQLCQTGPLYPARFATLFSSIEALQESVSRWEPELQSFFRRVDGKQEWACKVYLSKPKPAGESRTDQRPASAPDGRSYLLARRQASEAKQRQAELVTQVVDDLRQTLLDAGVDVVLRPPVQMKPADEDAMLIGNLALLIRQDQLEVVQSLTSDISPPDLLLRDVSVELSGPFAPYSFCSDLDPPSDQA